MKCECHRQSDDEGKAKFWYSSVVDRTKDLYFGMAVISAASFSSNNEPALTYHKYALTMASVLLKSNSEYGVYV